MKEPLARLVTEEAAKSCDYVDRFIVKILRTDDGVFEIYTTEGMCLAYRCDSEVGAIINKIVGDSRKSYRQARVLKTREFIIEGDPLDECGW